MKALSKTALITFVLGLFLARLASGQITLKPEPFSADVQFSSDRGGNLTRDMTGKMYFGSDHMRLDMQGTGHGGTVVLTDFKTQTADILMPEQQMYMEYKANENTARRLGIVPNIKPLRDPGNPCAFQEGMTCKNVGVEDIDGRSCDHWQITDKNGKVSNVWVDRKIHFPTKGISGDTTWTLTNIKEGQPDPGLFQIPAGYSKMDLGALMQMGHPPQP